MNIKKLGPNSLELPYSEHTSLIIKSCLDVWYKTLLPEHQAQVINYLQATGIPIGLLVNFGNKRLEYKRLHHPSFYPVAEGDHANPVFCC